MVRPKNVERPNQRTLLQNCFKSVALAEHCKNTGHELDTGNVKVLRREKELIQRKVKEAIAIKKETKPTLNRDGGRELSKIYYSLLAKPSSVGHHQRLELNDRQSVNTYTNR